MRRETILIVDDEKYNINILKELLDKTYDVMVAMNGEQAIKRANVSPPPDLILLDIMMPGMDGFQVLERLRADHATSEVPIIFITAMGNTDDETKGLALGAADYIAKPFSPSVVLARIQTQLRLKSSLVRERHLNQQLVSLSDELIQKNSQLIELNKTLQDLASLDGLTGIPNRRRFDEYLQQEWNRSMRDKIPLALILIDIDFLNLSMTIMAMLPVMSA
ncbi:MAG: response regulator [Magnetococcus sp. DMHC-1]